MGVQTWVHPALELESGGVLREAPIAFQTWGVLNAAADNAVVVCHALTGNTDVADWWGPLLGPGKLLDTSRYFVVCANVLGSPYGSVAPSTIHPATGQPYGASFPRITLRDTVRAHRALLEALGVQQIRFAIGGSMGGMQVLEWGAFRGFVQALVPIAVGASHSAWCLGWSEAQRQAIYADPDWQGGHYPSDRPPRAGLAAARMVAMLTYRTAASYAERFGRRQQEGRFSVASYLHYQGRKLVDRFDARCYVTLTHQMDTHDLLRGRSEEDLPAQPTLVIGIDTDGLYPLAEQRALAALLPKAALRILHAPQGHDAFLIAFDQLAALITPWMLTQTNRRTRSAA